jgi:hypothetical protein
MEKIPEKEYFCINKAGVLPALFRCYLNISSSFLRLTKSKMPLVAIRKMTSNLLRVDFDIPTLSRILQPAFFLTSFNGCIIEKKNYHSTCFTKVSGFFWLIFQTFSSGEYWMIAA